MKRLTNHGKQLLRINQPERRALVDLKVTPNRFAVLNPSLCDDIVTRLKPSLERHKGCDIIDLNPGIGLWSAKIHEAVKPRRHILVEPSYKKGYEVYLEPLLAAPDSKYKLVTWGDEAEQRSPKRYLEEGLLPDQLALSEDSPKTGGCNNSLLFLVNFDGLGIRGYRGNRANGYSHNWISAWCRAANTKENFHRNGYVRVLGWMHNSEKVAYLPRSVTDRTMPTFRTDMICHTEEIVGSSADDGRHRRSPEIEYLSSAAALARMEAAGTDMIGERLDRIPQDILKAKQESDNFDIKTVIPALATERYDRRKWHFELQKLEADFAAGKFDRPKRGDKDSQGALAWRRMHFLQGTDQFQRNWEGKLNDMVYKRKAMDEQDAAIRSNTALTEDERKQQLAALDALSQSFQEEKVEKLPHQRHLVLASQTDNIYGWEATPKLLTWDHRRAEPLLCAPPDFHPIRALALLDFQLHESPIRLPPKPYRYFELVVRFASHMLSGTVAQALTRMQFGAAEALIPKCPSLRDPRKGGKRDPGSVSARSLSREMLTELAYAWDDWVFASSPAEILASSRTMDMKADEWKGLKKMLGQKERIRPVDEE